MKRWIPFVLLLAALLMAGCAPAPSPEGESRETPIVPIPEEAQALIELARRELAKRLNEVDEAIDLIDVEAVEWPNTAMGCPKPGEMYAQVVTPGYRIRLRVRDQIYQVHVSKRGQIRFCPPVEQEGETMEIPEAAQPAVRAAQRDLASRLGLSVADIRVVDVEAVDWPDSSLGCPEPGKMYLQMITPGYRVVLQASGETYTYHTDRGTRAVLCASRPGAKPKGSPLVELRRAVERARTDLARRQGVDVQTITVVDAAPLDKVTSPRPCPQATKLGTLVGPEFQVILELEGATYVYRVRGEAVVLCGGR